MTDRPPYPDTSDDIGVGSDRESATGTPLWVKVFGIIVLILLLVFVILLLAGGHDPGRHT